MQAERRRGETQSPASRRTVSCTRTQREQAIFRPAAGQRTGFCRHSHFLSSEFAVQAGRNAGTAESNQTRPHPRPRFFLRTIDAASVVFNTSHPLRPILRLHRAGFGPGARRIELAMPLQRPQLLESHSPRGPIQEEAVSPPVMPVDTDTTRIRIGLRAGLHRLVVYSGGPSTLSLSPPSNHAIEKQRHIRRTFHKQAAPVLLASGRAGRRCIKLPSVPFV